MAEVVMVAVARQPHRPLPKPMSPIMLASHLRRCLGGLRRFQSSPIKFILVSVLPGLIRSNRWRIRVRRRCRCPVVQGNRWRICTALRSGLVIRNTMRRNMAISSKPRPSTNQISLATNFKLRNSTALVSLDTIKFKTNRLKPPN